MRIEDAKARLLQAVVGQRRAQQDVNSAWERYQIAREQNAAAQQAVTDAERLVHSLEELDAE